MIILFVWIRYLLLNKGWDIHVLSVKSGQVVNILKGHTGTVTNIIFNPGNQFQVVDTTICCLHYSTVGIYAKVVRLGRSCFSIICQVLYSLTILLALKKHICFSSGYDLQKMNIGIVIKHFHKNIVIIITIKIDQLIIFFYNFIFEDKCLNGRTTGLNSCPIRIVHVYWSWRQDIKSVKTCRLQFWLGY